MKTSKISAVKRLITTGKWSSLSEEPAIDLRASLSSDDERAVSAFHEGVLASKAGEPCTTNPYKQITSFTRYNAKLYMDWLDGWLWVKYEQVDNYLAWERKNA